MEGAPYRGQSAGHDEAHHYRYGPFPRSWRGLWQAGAAFALLIVASLFLDPGQTLECRRDSGKNQCVLTNRYLLISTHQKFPISSIRKADYYCFRGACVTKILRKDQETLYLERGGSKEAQLINEFLKSPDPRLELSAWPDPFLLFLVLPLVLIAAGLFLFETFRRPDTIDLLIFEGQAVRVVERWFGRALRKRTLSLTDVKNVRVVHGTHRPILNSGPDRPAGLVSLITRDDGIRPLTRSLMVGTEIHDQTAETLAELIGCEVERIDDD